MSVCISAFSYLVGIPVGSASSAVGIKTFIVPAVIKKCKSIIKKKKHVKIVNNVLNKYEELKEEIKNPSN